MGNFLISEILGINDVSIFQDIINNCTKIVLKSRVMFTLVNYTNPHKKVQLVHQGKFYTHDNSVN